MVETGKMKIIFAKYDGKPEEKRQRGRLGRGGGCNIKMYVTGIGFGKWTELILFRIGKKVGVL